MHEPAQTVKTESALIRSNCEELTVMVEQLYSQLNEKLYNYSAPQEDTAPTSSVVQGMRSPYFAGINDLLMSIKRNIILMRESLDNCEL